MTKTLVLVAFAAASTAFAQPPQGKRVQRERTAPGGISWAAYGFNGIGVVRLLEVKEIQKDLKIDKNDDVLSALPLLRDEFTETDGEYMRGLNDAAKVSRDSLLEFLMLRSKKVDGQIAEILGDRFQRFQEIRRQAFGVMASATADAVVRSSLAITDDQRTRFNAERKKLLDKALENARQGKKAVPPEVIDRVMREFATQEEKLFLSILTTEQAEKWKVLVGEPMTIPEEVLRFIRRGDYAKLSDGNRPPRRSRRDRSGVGKRDPGGASTPAGEGEKKPPLSWIRAKRSIWASAW